MYEEQGVPNKIKPLFLDEFCTCTVSHCAEMIFSHFFIKGIILSSLQMQIKIHLVITGRSSLHVAVLVINYLSPNQAIC